MQFVKIESDGLCIHTKYALYLDYRQVGDKEQSLLKPVIDELFEFRIRLRLRVPEVETSVRGMGMSLMSTAERFLCQLRDPAIGCQNVE